MGQSIKVRASAKDGVATVKCLISHEMETGTRRDAKTGELVPAHFIEEVACEHNGKVVMTANWGPAISKNPYLSFQVRNANSGDPIKVSWVDNKGESDSIEAAIK